MMPPSETSPDWDELYREGTTPWDKGRPAPPLLEWLGRHPGMISGSVLVPGCGLGHDARAIAALPEVSEVTGLDLSPTAVATAREFAAVGAEHFEQGNLFALPPEHLGRYDWIWEHTCFCAIDPGLRDAYVAAVHTALKPGSHLLGAFYFDPYDDEHPPGGGPPHGCSTGELAERFEKSGRFRILETTTPDSAFPGREGRERLVLMERRG